MRERRVPDRAARLGGREVDLRTANEAYDGELRATDEELGRLVQALKERGRWERTLLVVIGDHGEGLGQHGEPAHGLAWDDHTRVPWVIHGPGVEPGLVEEVCSATDLVPTLLPLLPALRLERLEAQCTGVDRLAAAANPGAVHTQSSPRQSQDRRLDHSLTEARWKLLRTSEGEELLFDLVADPHELVDLAEQHPEEVARLAAALDAVLVEEQRGETSTTRAATEEEETGLEALGYGGAGD
jgi:choline-sulfatase